MKLIQSGADKGQLMEVKNRETAGAVQKIDGEAPLSQNLIVFGRQHTQYGGVSIFVEVRFCEPI